jgi:ferrous iron transport protein A
MKTQLAAVRMAPHTTANSQVVSLAELAAGEAGAVLALHGGGGFVGRMAALGFTPGSEVQIVRNGGHGPLIVEVVDTQVALGRGEARRVIVRRS